MSDSFSKEILCKEFAEFHFETAQEAYRNRQKRGCDCCGNE